MSRFLDSGSNSSNALSAGMTQVLVGESVQQNDLLQIEAIGGNAYRVRVTDNAVVPTVAYGTAQTNAATGQIVAQTTIVASSTTAYHRQAVLQDADNGNIYTLTDNTVSAGLRLSKYSSVGALLAYAVIDTATNYVTPCLLQLSNGNMAVISISTTGFELKYAVYDKLLNVVRSLVMIDSQYSSNYYFGVTALSAGGFAVVYQSASATSLSKLIIYDNSGAVVQAATTIWTRTGTAGQQRHRIAQMSDSNLVIAVESSNSDGSFIGLYHGIVTTTAVSVLAFANLITTASGHTPDLSVMPGFYCISASTGSNQRGFVFNNSGVLQGSAFSGATSIAATNKTKLLNDGVNFCLLWSRNDTKMVLTKLPTTGTGYVTFDVTLSTTQYNFHIDAFYENGCIVAMSQSGSGNTPPTIWVIKAATGMLVSTSGTPFGSPPNITTGAYGRLISGGDGAFICLYDYYEQAATNLCIGKYVNTAIIGAAATAAAAGALAPVAASTGSYITNPIAGSPSKAFDMTATTQLYGNKGTVLNNCVILKGM